MKRNTFKIAAVILLLATLLTGCGFSSLEGNWVNDDGEVIRFDRNNSGTIDGFAMSWYTQGSIVKMSCWGITDEYRYSVSSNNLTLRRVYSDGSVSSNAITYRRLSGGGNSTAPVIAVGVFIVLAGIAYCVIPDRKQTAVITEGRQIEGSYETPAIVGKGKKEYINESTQQSVSDQIISGQKSKSIIDAPVSWYITVPETKGEMQYLGKHVAKTNNSLVPELVSLVTGEKPTDIDGKSDFMKQKSSRARDLKKYDTDVTYQSCKEHLSKKPALEKCRECDTILPDNAFYCPECGQPTQIRLRR